MRNPAQRRSQYPREVKKYGRKIDNNGTSSSRRLGPWRPPPAASMVVLLFLLKRYRYPQSLREDPKATGYRSVDSSHRLDVINLYCRFPSHRMERQGRTHNTGRQKGYVT